MFTIKVKKTIFLGLPYFILASLISTTLFANGTYDTKNTPDIPKPKIFNQKKISKKKSTRKTRKKISPNRPKEKTYNLLTVYKLALKNNPQFKINQYNSTGPAAALTNLKGAQGAFYPVIGLNSILASRSKSGNGSTSLGFQLDQTLLNFDYWYSYLAAKFSNKAALDNYINAQQTTIYQVAKAYYQILIDESQVLLQKQKVKSDKEIYNQTNQQYKVGLKPITDVKQAESTYLVDKADLLQYQNNVIADKRALQALIAVYPENIAQLKKVIRYTPPSPNNVDTWINKSYQLSPLLKATKNTFTASKENYKAQWSNRYLPTLGIEARYGWADLDTPGGQIFNNKKINDYAAALQLNMDLFNLPETANTQTQKVNSMNSRYLMQKTKRNLREQISLDFNDINLYIAQIKAYKKAVEAAKISYKAALAGYEVGTQTITTVQQQLTDLYTAKNQEADAKFYYILAWLQFKQDLGTLNINDIVLANNFLVKV